MSQPPEARKTSGPKGHHIASRPARNARTPLPLTIKSRGGPEAWVEIVTRGVTVRVPGWVAVHDLVMYLNCQGPLGVNPGR